MIAGPPWCSFNIHIHFDGDSLLKPMTIVEALDALVVKAENAAGACQMLQASRVHMEAQILVINQVDTMVRQNCIQTDVLIHCHTTSFRVGRRSYMNHHGHRHMDAFTEVVITTQLVAHFKCHWDLLLLSLQMIFEISSQFFLWGGDSFSNPILRVLIILVA